MQGNWKAVSVKGSLEKKGALNGYEQIIQADWEV